MAPLTSEILCIPYAGGSSSMYYSWKTQLKSKLKVTPIELKGRGKRFGEPHYETFEEAVLDVVHQIELLKPEEGYSLFGHSFGGMLAYETSKILEQRETIAPHDLIISGCLPPDSFGQIDGRSLIHQLDDENLIMHLQKIGATPELILKDKQLLNVFLPVIRNDFRLVETYKHTIGTKINLPISIFVGDKDLECNPEVVENWSRYTENQHVAIKVFSGGHFFIFEDQQNVFNSITTILSHKKIQKEYSL